MNKTTQQQLADAIERDQSTISHWITGRKKPDTDTIALAATALGVRSAWLAFGDGDMTESSADAPPTPPTPPTPKRRSIPPAAPRTSKRAKRAKPSKKPAAKPGVRKATPRSSALEDLDQAV